MDRNKILKRVYLWTIQNVDRTQRKEIRRTMRKILSRIAAKEYKRIYPISSSPRNIYSTRKLDKFPENKIFNGLSIRMIKYDIQYLSSISYLPSSRGFIKITNTINQAAGLFKYARPLSKHMALKDEDIQHHKQLKGT